MNKNTALLYAAFIVSGLTAGCQPRTPAEKVKDKVEDATHEAGQAIERAGKRVKESVD